MDQKCRLNKTELQEIKRLLGNFVMNDETIQTDKKLHELNDLLKAEIQKFFNEKMNITPEIKKWFDDHNCMDTNYIYYHDCNYSDIKYHETYFDNIGRLDQVLITTYVYNLRYNFIANYKTELANIYNKFFDEHLSDITSRIEKYDNIMKEMIIVLNGLKTAQNVLDKFGFIDSINKYINKLLSEQAKPISLMTKAVENSVDNYLSQRKALDEAEK